MKDWRTRRGYQIKMLPVSDIAWLTNCRMVRPGTGRKDTATVTITSRTTPWRLIHEGVRRSTANEALPRMPL
jgi:hypothetical protein